MIRKIVLYKNYYLDFLKKLSINEKVKLEKAVLLLETEDRIPYHYIKYIRDGIYEYRVNYGNNEFRVFYIYDGNTIVVLFNGFKKKTQKTPQNEIEKALKLKIEYYEQK
ncbi:MAG: type II toxin-antitoxin system RelE/ParE family toxin [Paludibacter sp.]